MLNDGFCGEFVVVSDSLCVGGCDIGVVCVVVMLWVDEVKFIVLGLICVV